MHANIDQHTCTLLFNVIYSQLWFSLSLSLSLRYLDNNFLSGSIPSSIFTLDSLITLWDILPLYWTFPSPIVVIVYSKAHARLLQFEKIFRFHFGSLHPHRCFHLTLPKLSTLMERTWEWRFWGHLRFWDESLFTAIVVLSTQGRAFQQFEWRCPEFGGRESSILVSITLEGYVSEPLLFPFWPKPSFHEYHVGEFFKNLQLFSSSSLMHPFTSPR